MFAGASLDENSGAFCELKANFFRLILTKAEVLKMMRQGMKLEILPGMRIQGVRMMSLVARRFLWM